MSKWKLTLFYIVTFGIGYFVLKNKAKKISKVENQEIEVSTNIPFDIDKFLSIIGGIENIEKTESTISSINIYFKNKIKDININFEELNKLKPKGVMKYESKISIVFGDFSKELSKIINGKINEI